MGGAQTAEVPALHAALETLTDGVTGDIDELARNEVIGGQRRAGFEERIRGDAEFGDLGLGLDFRLGEMAALGLGGVLGLLDAGTELDGDIAIDFVGADADDLAAFERHNRHGDVLTVAQKEPGHSHFLRDHATAHDQFLSYQRPRQNISGWGHDQ